MEFDSQEIGTVKLGVTKQLSPSLSLDLDYQQFSSKSSLHLREVYIPEDNDSFNVLGPSEPRPADTFNFENMDFSGPNSLRSNLDLQYSNLALDYRFKNDEDWKIYVAAILQGQSTKLRVKGNNTVQNLTSQNTTQGLSYGYRIKARYYFWPLIFAQSSFLKTNMIHSDDISNFHFEMSLRAQLHKHLILYIERSNYFYEHKSNQGSNLTTDIELAGVGLTLLL